MRNYILGLSLSTSLLNSNIRLYSSFSHQNGPWHHLPLSKEPSNADLECISNRQVFSDTEGVFAVNNDHCKYGFPQAFIRYPVGTRISSGMLRLSCPLLVKGIDEYEADGGIEHFNAMLAKNESLRENFNRVNYAWRDIKILTTTPEQRRRIVTLFGEDGAENILNSGIIGVTQHKLDDVKCLHAHTADYLLRGDNLIGMLVLEKLRDREVEVRGCAQCSDQCGGKISKEEAKFWYVPAKNKLKLQARRERRIQFKQKIRDMKAVAAEVSRPEDDDLIGGDRDEKW